jgi:membrane associated rhomboid family serine protease
MIRNAAFYAKISMPFVLAWLFVQLFSLIASARGTDMANQVHSGGSALSWVVASVLSLLVWVVLMVSMNGARGREEA